MGALVALSYNGSTPYDVIVVVVLGIERFLRLGRIAHMVMVPLTLVALSAFVLVAPSHAIAVSSSKRDSIGKVTLETIVQSRRGWCED